MLAQDNLELAWARARRYAFYEEVLGDEAEIKLFDHNLNDKLHRLRNHLLMQEWNILNVTDTLFFQSPKKSSQTRPKTISRLEEQILSAAIIQTLGVNFNQIQAHSYSFRLNPHPDEYLYERWFSLYRAFLNETRKLAARRHKVLRADISSFYTERA